MSIFTWMNYGCVPKKCDMISNLSMRLSQKLFNKLPRRVLVVVLQATDMAVGSDFLCPLGGGQRLRPSQNLLRSTFKLGTVTVRPEIEGRSHCPGVVKWEP